MILSAEDVALDGASKIMLDANIIIAYLDSKHKFHDKVRNRLTARYVEGANFYYTLPCILEVKNYWRRKFITETIEAHLQQGKKLFSRFQKEYNKYRTSLLANQDYLNEFEIKCLRGTLEAVVGGKGLRFWFEFCDLALNEKIQQLDQTLLKINLKYSKFDDDDVFPLSNKNNWPSWDQCDQIIEKFGLASNDAAILNMANKGIGIDGFISNDGDMVFAIQNGALNSSVFGFTFLDPDDY